MTGRLSVRAVIEAVSGVTGVSADDILSPRTARRITRPRQIAMYFANRYCTHLSPPEIGRRMGARDQSTIRYGINKIAAEVEEHGFDTTLTAIDAVLAPAITALKALQIDATEPDPMIVAERAMTEHGAARITIDEIRSMARFVLAAIVGGGLIIDPQDEAPADVGVIKTARRVVMAGRAFVSARYGAGERSAIDGLLAAISDLEAAYAEEVEPISASKPSFKTTSSTPRKEASHGHA
jgi:hypothetical protein